MSQDDLLTKKQSFKSLTVLRKALVQAHTGDILYETASSKGKKCIKVTVGDLLNDKETLGELEALLLEPVNDCELVSKNFEKSLGSATPPEALTAVLNDIKWHPDVLEKLKATFLKLPPIQVRMVPMYKYGYHDGLTYMSLYHQSVIKKEEFTVNDFLSEENNYTTVEQKIKVLVLGYCLGLINPSVKKAAVKTNTPKQRRSSIASRIIDKIRGM